jgi:uncharacterized membrane protein YagU involved in acid resistance
MIRSGARYAILAGGAIAGALDIAYAIAWAYYRGSDAMHLLQIVASGWLGEAAFDGGWTTAMLGLASHFGMAFAYAAFFYFVARRMDWLVRHTVVAGLLYGFAVFLLMNLVVLPLSAFPYPVKFTGPGPATNLLSHLFFFGLPIALCTRRALRPRAFTRE